MPNKSPLQIEFERQLSEFDERYHMYNPVNDNGINLPVWNGADYENIKSFLTSCQQSTVKKIVEMIEEKVKSNYKHNYGHYETHDESVYNSALSDILSELNKAIY